MNTMDGIGIEKRLSLIDSDLDNEVENLTFALETKNAERRIPPYMKKSFEPTKFARNDSTQLLTNNNHFDDESTKRVTKEDHFKSYLISHDVTKKSPLKDETDIFNNHKNARKSSLDMNRVHIAVEQNSAVTEKGKTEDESFGSYLNVMRRSSMESSLALIERIKSKNTEKGKNDESFGSYLNVMRRSSMDSSLALIERIKSKNMSEQSPSIVVSEGSQGRKALQSVNRHDTRSSFATLVDQNDSYSDNEKQMLEEMKRMEKEHHILVKSYEDRVHDLMGKMSDLKNIAELLENSGNEKSKASKKEVVEETPKSPTRKAPPPPIPPKAPPPPPKAPPPPPKAPPPPMAEKQQMPSKPTTEPHVKMRTLFWSRILLPEDDKVTEKKTIWHHLKEPAIDKKEIESFFSTTAINEANKPPISLSESMQKRKSWCKSAGAKILDEKRSRVVAIRMKAMHCDLKDIENAIYKMDFSKISIESLRGLNEIRGTPQEIQCIEQFVAMNQAAPLDEAEKFLYELSKFSKFAERLNCIVFKAKFIETMLNIDQQVTLLYDASCLIKDSESVRHLFEMILACGNYMNGGTSRGQADGFNMEILTKIKDVKGGNNINLLHYVIRLYVQTYESEEAGKNGAKFKLPDPGTIRQAAQVSIPSIKNEMSGITSQLVLNKKLASAVIKESEESKKQPFQSALEDFFLMADDKLITIGDKLSRAESAFDEMNEYLGNRAVNSDNLFSTWATFLDDCRRFWNSEQRRIARTIFEKVDSRRKAILSAVRPSTVGRLMEENGDMKKRPSLKEKFARIKNENDSKVVNVRDIQGVRSDAQLSVSSNNSEARLERINRYSSSNLSDRKSSLGYTNQETSDIERMTKMRRDHDYVNIAELDSIIVSNLDAPNSIDHKWNQLVRSAEQTKIRDASQKVTEKAERDYLSVAMQDNVIIRKRIETTKPVTIQDRIKMPQRKYDPPLRKSIHDIETMKQNGEIQYSNCTGIDNNKDLISSSTPNDTGRIISKSAISRLKLNFVPKTINSAGKNSNLGNDLDNEIKKGNLFDNTGGNNLHNGRSSDEFKQVHKSDAHQTRRSSLQPQQSSTNSTPTEITRRRTTSENQRTSHQNSVNVRHEQKKHLSTPPNPLLTAQELSNSKATPSTPDFSADSSFARGLHTVSDKKYSSSESLDKLVGKSGRPRDRKPLTPSQDEPNSNITDYLNTTLRVKNKSISNKSAEITHAGGNYPAKKCVEISAGSKDVLSRKHVADKPPTLPPRALFAEKLRQFIDAKSCRPKGNRDREESYNLTPETGSTQSLPVTYKRQTATTNDYRSDTESKNRHRLLQNANDVLGMRSHQRKIGTDRPPSFSLKNTKYEAIDDSADEQTRVSAVLVRSPVLTSPELNTPSDKMAAPSLLYPQSRSPEILRSEPSLDTKVSVPSENPTLILNDIKRRASLMKQPSLLIAFHQSLLSDKV